MKIDLDKIKSANEFSTAVDNCARELLGRSYKKYLKKGDLTVQAENKIKSCLTNKHVALFGTEFLGRWAVTYLYYYYADVYSARFAHDGDSWNSEVYCNAFFGLVFKEFT